MNEWENEWLKVADWIYSFLLVRRQPIKAISGSISYTGNLTLLFLLLVPCSCIASPVLLLMLTVFYWKQHWLGKERLTLSDLHLESFHVLLCVTRSMKWIGLYPSTESVTCETVMKSLTRINRHEKWTLAFLSSVVRGLARNVQVYNPTPNSLDVRWDSAPGPVQQYRIVYSPVAGTRPSESVSHFVVLELGKEHCQFCCGFCHSSWLGDNNCVTASHVYY